MKSDKEIISSSPADGPPICFASYKIRWYILAVFCLVSFAQNMIYSTWGPISISAEKAFNLTQTDFAILPNWYNVGYFVAVFPFIWLVQEKGLRYGVLLTASLCAAGAGVRSIPCASLEINRALIHIGQILNGLAAPGGWFLCTELSAIWFPPNERPLATAIGLSSGAVGTAASFAVPTFIAAFKPGTHDDTAKAIQFLLYRQFCFTGVLLIVVLLYFPNHPTTPPCYTATVKRLSLCQGLRALTKASQAWTMVKVYAVSTAIFTSWDQIMTQFLKPAMTEEETGWLGVVSVIVSIFAGPALSVTAPFWIYKHSKLVCVALMTVGCICLAILTISAMFFQEILFTRTTIWTTILVSSIAIAAPQPIWWELSCDAAYPVAEATVSGIATLGSCVGSSLFFFLYMFPSLGTNWPIWALLASEVICIPALLSYKPSSRRTQEDERHAGILPTPEHVDDGDAGDYDDSDDKSPMITKPNMRR